MQGSENILKLNAEAVWLAAVFAVNKMLCGFLSWEKKLCDKGNKAIVGDFTKRVSVWHEYTLEPVEVLVKTNLHKRPPAFARNVLQKEHLESMQSTRNNIFELNTQLLIEASNMLISCLEFGIGKGTKKEIKRWFNLMRSAKVFLARHAAEETQNNFSDIFTSYSNKVESLGNDLEESKEYPFFKHGILFIHIAHIVSFTCVSHCENQNSSLNQNLIQVPFNVMELWEKQSGSLFSRYFNLGSGGLPLEADVNDNDPTFTLIDLPCHWFSQVTHEKKGLPPVNELHMTMMNIFDGKISEIEGSHHISQSELYQVSLLEELFSRTASCINESEFMIKKREKARRNQRKKTQHSSAYKPINPPLFQRNIFLMGKESYYHHFMTPAGRAYRKVVSSPPRVRNQE